MSAKCQITIRHSNKATLENKESVDSGFIVWRFWTTFYTNEQSPRNKASHAKNCIITCVECISILEMSRFPLGYYVNNLIVSYE